MGLEKSLKLLSRHEYKKVYQNGKRLEGSLLKLDYRFGEGSQKLGITISKKWGKAHERNRFKRVIRESFRQCHLALPKHLEVSVYPMRDFRTATTQTVIKEMRDLLEHLIPTTESAPRRSHPNN